MVSKPGQNQEGTGQEGGRQLEKPLRSRGRTDGRTDADGAKPSILLPRRPSQPSKARKAGQAGQRAERAAKPHLKGLHTTDAHGRPGGLTAPWGGGCLITSGGNFR